MKGYCNDTYVNEYKEDAIIMNNIEEIRNLTSEMNFP